MRGEEVLESFSNLNIWRREGERAPHKPLLLLLALGALAQEKPRLIPFAEFDKPLQDLLREFGPPRKSFHSEYPFWRLQTMASGSLKTTTKLNSGRATTMRKRASC